MRNFIYKCTSFITILSLISTSLFVLTTPSSSEAAITDCTAVVGNLIQNCGFENPVGVLTGVEHNTPTQDVLDNNYAGIPNWPTFDDGGKQGNVGVLHDDTLIPSIQGVRYIDVSGHTYAPDFVEKAGMGIQQTVTGLTIGATYNLKFAQGYSTFLPASKVTVLIDGIPSTEGVGGFNVNNSTPGTTNLVFNKWKEQQTTFVATATSVTIAFRGEITGLGRGDFVDNVVLLQVLDTTPPTLTIISPSNGAVVSGPFTATICPSEPITGLTLPADIIVGNGTPSGLTGPTVVPIATCPGGEVYTVTITPAVEGVVTVDIPATSVLDLAGNANTAASNTLTVTYDITPPIFTNVHIQSNNANPSYATTGDTVTITWTVDVGGPDIPFSSNGYTIQNPGSSILPSPSCTAGPIRSCSVSFVVAADTAEGLLDFNVNAENNGVTQAQTGSTDGSSVTVDRTPPVVIITAPVGGSEVGPTMVITGQCEYSPSASTTVTISGSGFTPNPTTTTCTSGGTFTTSTLTNSGGNPTIIATQLDLAGNTGSDTESYILTSPPVVTITGPAGIVGTGANNITGTCTTTSGTVTISGSGFTPSSGTTSCIGGLYTFPITITGNTTFSVFQTNVAGTTTVNGSTSLPVVISGGGGGTPLIDVCNNIADNQFSVPPGLTRDPVTGYCYSTPITNPPTQQPTTNTNPSSGQGTGNTSVPATCTPYLTSYIKLGGQNDPEQVKKLETFLNEFENANLPVNGTYEEADFLAVKNFQSKYLSHVLSPWGINYATGFVYQTTLAKINALVCAKNSGCPQFTEYVHAGDVKTEVSKIKSFFNLIRPENNFDITDTSADSKFVDQVRKFQSRFATFVLGSWDLRGTTGYWYKTTRYQANDFMGCRENPVTLENGKTVGF